MMKSRFQESQERVSVESLCQNFVEKAASPELSSGKPTHVADVAILDTHPHDSYLLA